MKRVCYCHGLDYPHEWASVEWCCVDADDEPDEMDIARDWLISQDENDNDDRRN